MRHLDSLPEGAVQTGVFARAIIGHNWSRRREGTLYGPSWMTLPILASPERNRKVEKASRKARPEAWPVMYDHIVSLAAEQIFDALTPPRKIAGTMVRRNDGLRDADIIRACEIAGTIQARTANRDFVLVYRAYSERRERDGTCIGLEASGLAFEGIVPVAALADDHGAAEHALGKAEGLFYDLPAAERQTIWDDLFSGALLDERDRARLTELPPDPPAVLPADYKPYRPEEMRLRQPEPTPTFNTIIDKVTGEETRLEPDPKVDDAFARLAAVMKIPPRPPV